jgi:hypothetical protein
MSAAHSSRMMPLPLIEKMKLENAFKFQFSMKISMKLHISKKARVSLKKILFMTVKTFKNQAE